MRQVFLTFACEIIIYETIKIKTLYDLIGDIHGYCNKLKELLLKLDYKEVKAVWKHPSRKAIFVGDYIDRGPEIRETLQLVRNMVEGGAAIALMGNHEYNAVAYARKLEDGTYLRSHNGKHTKQHKATLDQFANYPKEWQSYLKWFYTLPLFLDMEQLRVVHACWDDDHINWLKTNGCFNLNDELLLASHQRNTMPYEVINDTLKGKEFNLPYVWYDKDGNKRSENRLKWWLKPDQANFGEFLFDCPKEMEAVKVPADIQINIYLQNAPPVFFGHYWLEDKFPVIQAENVICLDYSVAKNGSLVAYRWSGEEVIDNKNFVVVS